MSRSAQSVGRTIKSAILVSTLTVGALAGSIVPASAAPKLPSLPSSPVGNSSDTQSASDPALNTPFSGTTLGMVAPQAKISDGYFTSKDGKGTKIYYKKNLVPQAKGSVLVIHGLAEHSGRYDYVTYRLNQAGYNVYRLDHRGHGKSRQPHSSAKMGNVDSFTSLVDDMHILSDMARSETQGKKVFMLGHSMGAMATQMFSVKYPTAVDGTITNGGAIPFNAYGPNNLKPQYITPANLPQENQKLGPSKIRGLENFLGAPYSAPVEELVEPYNKPGFFPTPATPASQAVNVPNSLGSGVVVDKRIREEYANDPLNCKSFTAATATQILQGITYAGLNAKKYTRPTLIMHGDNDGIVPMPLNINWYNAVGSTDKQMIVWNKLRHETMNEVVRDQVIDKAIGWLNAHL